MKKKLLILILSAVSLAQVFSQPISFTVAPPFDNSTTQVRAPNGLNTQAYMRACALVLGTELSAIAPNTTLTAFGFTLNAPASANVTGTMAIYLENTTDLTYTKGLTFSTAIAPMTLVYNSTVTVPGPGTFSISVNLSTPFTYTGGGLYVAYDWFSLGPFAATPATYRANSTGLIGGCATAAGTGPAPTTLGSTSFRPCFLFGVANTFTNEVEVGGVSSPGWVPASFNVPHSVLANIRNASAITLTNIPVTLTVGGANPVTVTQTIASLGSGAVTTVTFAGQNPQLPGLNTISVTVPSDQNNTNNLSTYNQSVTCSDWGINPAAVSYTMGSVGFNTGSGIIAVTYSNPVSSTLVAVRGAVSTNSASVGNNSWGVLLSSTGVILATTNTVAITSGMLGTFNTYSFAAPPALASGSTYYIGFAQPVGSVGYFPMGTYTSAYVPFTSYVTTSTLGGVVTPLASNLGYFGIEAVFAPNMTLSASPQAIICGASANLTVNSSGSYTWSTGPANTSITVSPTVSTVYTVVASNTIGCVSARNVSVTVNPLPVMASSDASIICLGSVVTLSAAGAPTYSWSSGSTSATFTDSPTTTTTYTLEGTNPSGCSNTTVITVAVTTFSTMLVSNSSMTTCLGNSLTLSASGANSYTWNTGTGTSTGSVIFFTPSSSVVYTITGTDALGCEDEETVSITVNSFTPGVTSPTAICIGGQVVLTATGGAANTYTWSTNSPFNSITVNPTVTTTYSVVATGINGCAGMAATTITVNQLPLVNITANRPEICRGETTTLTASGAGTYSWNNGTSGATQVLTATISLNQFVSCTGTDINGCSNTGTITLVVNACVGLDEVSSSNSGIQIFPNPGVNQISVKIENNNKPSTLIMMNALGQKVLEQGFSGKDTIELEVEALSKGVYSLYVISENKPIGVKTFIKE